MPQGNGRTLVGSAYTSDDGAADPAVRRLFTSSASPAQIVEALRDARLLVAVMARLDTQVDGEDKDSHMALVSMVTADGRTGLLAFTGVDSLQAWDPSARPVPATGAQIAQAAQAEGRDAVVIDVAGPTTVVLAEDVLAALADSQGSDDQLAESQ